MHGGLGREQSTSDGLPLPLSWCSCKLNGMKCYDLMLNSSHTVLQHYPAGEKYIALYPSEKGTSTKALEKRGQSVSVASLPACLHGVERKKNGCLVDPGNEASGCADFLFCFSVFMYT